MAKKTSRLSKAAIRRVEAFNVWRAKRVWRMADRFYKSDTEEELIAACQEGDRELASEALWAAVRWRLTEAKRNQEAAEDHWSQATFLSGCHRHLPRCTEADLSPDRLQALFAEEAAHPKSRYDPNELAAIYAEKERYLDWMRLLHMSPDQRADRAADAILNLAHSRANADLLYDRVAKGIPKADRAKSRAAIETVHALLGQLLERFGGLATRTSEPLPGTGE